MDDQIVNRVAKSDLKTIDLEDYYPSNTRVIIDIKKWLYEGLILKESSFRDALKNVDWSVYKNTFVGLTCTSDAIIPSWAYMLITTYLTPFAKLIIEGNAAELENAIFQNLIYGFSVEEFKNKPVIIKGCSNKPIPQTAYILLIEKLQPIVKSLKFGEPCSTVPLYKRK